MARSHVAHAGLATYRASHRMSQVLAILFYALMLFAAAYFLHKVLWFIRYRRLQKKMVAHALARLTEQADGTVVQWDRGARNSWNEATQQGGPSSYVRSVEERLGYLEAELSKDRATIAPVLLQAVQTGEGPAEVQVLQIPRLEGEAIRVAVPLRFSQVRDPELPPESLFKLEVQSRYSFRRRLLAFLLGAADIVYSSQHVIRMSQNPNTPRGLLFRRVLLVLLILIAVVVDIGFGIRHRLVEWAGQLCDTHLSLSDGFLKDILPSALGLGIWLLGYGALYVGLYGFLRLRSGMRLRALRTLRETYPEKIQNIRASHLQALLDWTAEYGGSLDDAASLAIRQAEMLVQRTTHRLRRRVASEELLGLAERSSRHFFERLPESATQLQDVATSRKHSIWHSIWPRRKEMKYQVAIAQYRHAWRELEVIVAQLRSRHPDPELASQLWRDLVRYAQMFPDVIPSTLFAELRRAHSNTVAGVVDETEADLAELDERLIELGRALSNTVLSASPLIQTRIEVTDEAIDAEVADFCSRALKLREEARLEAMAFEI